MFSITAIPAFQDNYLWLLSCGNHAVIVDPGDAAPVMAALADKQLQLDAILITHHHLDHIGGIRKLREKFDVPVYGPRAEGQKIPGLTHLLDGGDHVQVLGLNLKVMTVPGHTLGHIAYYDAPLLFCGDTLFSAGCGRLFEGTPLQMHDSLNNIAALPGNTQIYCTHEYTLSNLAFALTVEPGNAALRRHIEAVKAMRARNQPSVPTTLELERRINPFLRVEVPEVQDSARHRDAAAITSVEVFAALRRWKDEFRASAAL